VSINACFISSVYHTLEMFAMLSGFWTPATEQESTRSPEHPSESEEPDDREYCLVPHDQTYYFGVLTGHQDAFGKKLVYAVRAPEPEKGVTLWVDPSRIEPLSEQEARPYKGYIDKCRLENTA